MYKKYLISCIFIAAVILMLNGCEKQDNSNANINNSVNIQAVTKAGINYKLSNEVLNEEKWDSIRFFTQFIGQPISELGEKGSTFNYTWYANNEQQINGESNVFYYSDLLFGSNEEVTCTAISALGFDALPPDFNEKVITEDVLKKYWGDGYTYHKKVGKLNGYYKYTFENVEVIFYENSDGSILPAENCIFIKAIDQDFYAEMIVNNIDQAPNFLDGSKRNGDKWKSVNQYCGFLNKPIAEVLDNKERFEFDEEKLTYTDLIANVKYTYYIDDTGTQICGMVSVPISLLFNNKNRITMNDLRSYWGIEFSWFLYEGYSYCYSFNDVMIYIPSDEAGIIDSKDFAYLKPAPNL